jgi:hypothetical protein
MIYFQMIVDLVPQRYKNKTTDEIPITMCMICDYDSLSGGPDPALDVRFRMSPPFLDGLRESCFFDFFDSLPRWVLVRPSVSVASMMGD